MLVSDLWKTGQREWDEAKILQNMSHNDVDLVKNILLLKHAISDTFIWPYTKDGVYTVKSGNWVASHQLQFEDEIIPPSGSLDLKVQVWKLDILPKIQHFLWKCITGAQATATRLLSRNVHIDPISQRCCMEEETINHVLFECPHAKAVWQCSNIPNQPFESPSIDLEENIRKMFSLSNLNFIPLMFRILPLWISWTIWKSRNEYLFNKRNVHPNEDAIRAQEASMKWVELMLKNREEETRVANRSKSSHWDPPMEGWIKLNFDSSYRANEEFTAVGWIARHKGNHVMSGCAKVRSCSSSLQAEALGFLHVLHIAWCRGWRQVWFETDNEELALLVNMQKESVDI